MTNPFVSPAAREAYAQASPNAITIQTLELVHSSFDAPLRIVKDSKEFTAQLETGATATFRPFPFRSRLPDVSQSLPMGAQIVLDNVSGEIAEMLSSSTPLTGIEAIYRPYEVNDSGSTETSFLLLNPPPVFLLRDVTINQFNATFNLDNKLNWVDRRFVNQFYTTREFERLQDF